MRHTRPFILGVLTAALVAAGCNGTQQTTATSTAEAAGNSKSTSQPQTNIAKPKAPQRTQIEEREAAASAVLHKRARALHDSVAHESMRSIQPAPIPIYVPAQSVDRENYAHFDENPIKRVAENPVSTFSIDVDTGAYSNVSRFLNQGQMPRHDAVRIEELINYFDYAYALPQEKSQPFGVSTEITETPWNSKTRLLQVGIQGWKPQGEIPPSNLVFLIDVSGSMGTPDKLPLLRSAMKLLVKQLGEQDRISIAVYAGAAGMVLEPTPGDQHAKISRAIDNLNAGGSTNGGAGIKLAYSLAQQGFIKGGVNRVILASDGDFNVGTVNFEALVELVSEQRKSNIALTTLGFGTGNYNDHLVEQLSNKGNGNYAYIDNLAEAQRVLVDNRAATLQTIAKDVKIQIEFNPASVSEYRLIGYENRALAREDFNNDQVDAGEIGAGHTVTALYEIALAGDGGERIDPLRYSAEKKRQSGAEKIYQASDQNELAFLRLRYKMPNADNSKLLEYPVTRNAIKPLNTASDNLRFAAAVAGFGQLLRGGDYTEAYNYDQVLQLARQARGTDEDGRRGEFLQLVQLAESLSTNPAQARR